MPGKYPHYSISLNQADSNHKVPENQFVIPTAMLGEKLNDPD